MLGMMVNLDNGTSVDPDAQATVTDFLDYTEYLPSDILRSLTLIRGLDETYLSSSSDVHDLTQQYGSLPTIPAAARPDSQALRSQISAQLDRALNARESSYAEACRLYDVADRHYNRLNSIINKLHALPKPPSRDPTPQAASRSPDIKRSRSGRKIEHGTSTQRLTLNPPRAPAATTTILSRPRGHRITVPGEVLPPYNPDSPIASTEVTDWESDAPSPIRPVIKLKQSKPPKIMAETAAKPREHRGSSIPYRKPTPPPEEAELGSKYRPWTRLTEWEMYKLRKKMKKNHTWDPSDVMIKRTLEAKGRGWDNYYAAKAEAQTKGTRFIDSDNLDRSRRKTDKDVLSTPTEEKTLTLKRTDSRKPKKDAQAREQAALAALAAQEAELAARRLGDIGSAFKNLFTPLSTALASLQRSASSPTTNGDTTGRRATSKPSKKRKLEDIDVLAPSPSIEAESRKKKQKTAPLPSPMPATESPPPPTIKLPLKLNLAVSEANTPTTVTRASTTRRSSAAPKTESTPPMNSRPSSRRSAAASVEPAIVTTRASRRTSTPASGMRGTPAAETTPRTTAASRRSRREAPGTVTQSSQDGGAAVSISNRKTKPTKQFKATSTPKEVDSSVEIRVDVDGKQEVLNPEEERYCVCGDVSWGEMICCELDEKCEHGQWFHMECVHLPELPPRTVKWYCPGDRKKLHRGENTNGLVGRGIK